MEAILTARAEAPVAAGPRFRHERSLGAIHPQIGFDLPVDLAMSRDGRLYVIFRGQSSAETSAPRGEDPAVNQSEHRLADRASIWNIGDEWIKKFGGGQGGGVGELIWPASVATDDARLYITDEATHDVRVFDLDGEHLETWGRRGTGAGELNSPAGIAIDRDGNVLVVDSANHRLQRFSPRGKPLGAWGQHGSGRGEFERPWGAAVDAHGDVYVSDWGNDRVQKFSAGGLYLATFGSSGSGEGQLRRPAGLAVDAYGCLFVADCANDRVAVFAPDGRHYATLLGDATLGKRAIQYYYAHPGIAHQRETADAELTRAEQRLRHPRGVKIDQEGRVLIADSERHRIQVYQRLSFDLPRLDRNGGGEHAATIRLGETVIGAEQVSPVLATFLRGWNENLADTDRAVLSSYAKTLVGTVGSAADDKLRGSLATDWLVRTAGPVWLELAGLADHAAKLRALPKIDPVANPASARALVESARDAAYAAAWSAGAEDRHYAAYEAARAQTWPAVAAADSEELAIGARNIAGAAAWAAASDSDLAATLSELRASGLRLLERMIGLRAPTRG